MTDLDDFNAILSEAHPVKRKFKLVGRFRHLLPMPTNETHGFNSSAFIDKTVDECADIIREKLVKA